MFGHTEAMPGYDALLNLGAIGSNVAARGEVAKRFPYKEVR